MTLRSLPLAFVGVIWSTVASGQHDKSHTAVKVNWSPATTTSAVCVGKQGWFVSIIPEAVSLEGLAAPLLQTGDQTISAEILHLDAEQRLCLLESESPIPGASTHPFSKGKRTKPGQTLSCKAKGGICKTTVAGKDQTYLGKPLSMPLLRVRVEDAEQFCHPGIPLFNDRGELEGILTERHLTDRSEVYAIPAKQLKKLVEEVAQFHRSGTVWVGLVFHSETTTPEVLEVRPDSPAMKAGIEIGDVILRLDGSDIGDLDELTEAIHELPAGKETSVVVLRGLDKENLTLVPEFADSHQAGVPN